MRAQWVRVIPEDSSEGFWCTRCREHRVRSSTGRCPSCTDDDLRAAQEKKAP